LTSTHEGTAGRAPSGVREHDLSARAHEPIQETHSASRRSARSRMRSGITFKVDAMPPTDFLGPCPASLLPQHTDDLVVTEPALALDVIPVCVPTPLTRHRKPELTFVGPDRRGDCAHQRADHVGGDRGCQDQPVRLRKRLYPAPGLGGHCIPIDPFYLTRKAREPRHHYALHRACRRDQHCNAALCARAPRVSSTSALQRA
jgi:hypothetical protein